MSYCPRCGVEVDSDTIECPLCETLIQERRDNESLKLKNYPERKIEKPGNDFRKIAEKKFLVWELLSIFFLISIISIISIDLGIRHKISWSIYPLTAIGTIWAGVTVILFLSRFKLLTVISNFILLSFFLFFLDFYSGGAGWFLTMALPIVLLFLITVILFAFIILRLKNNGLNTMGVVLVGISFFCAGLENILAFNHNGGFSFSWSLIVGFSLIPVAGFLVYLHYRFTSVKRYRGWFHF